MIMNLHTYKGLIFMKVKTWYRYLYAPTIVYFNHWLSFFLSFSVGQNNFLHIVVLTVGFLLLRIFSVAISERSNVCFILDLILISMFLR